MALRQRFDDHCCHLRGGGSVRREILVQQQDVHGAIQEERQSSDGAFSGSDRGGAFSRPEKESPRRQTRGACNRRCISAGGGWVNAAVYPLAPKKPRFGSRVWPLTRAPPLCAQRH